MFTEEGVHVLLLNYMHAHFILTVLPSSPVVSSLSSISVFFHGFCVEKSICRGEQSYLTFFKSI